MFKYDVLQVTAEDLDGDDTDDGRVSYSIRGGDGLGSFIIDEEGNIRSAKHLGNSELNHDNYLCELQDTGSA